MLRHEVIKYFDYEVTKSTNADIVHDYGFFIGNHPVDIRDKIDYLYRTLKKHLKPSGVLTGIDK